MLAAILAHQGGWDEMLMVLGPLGLFAYLLHRANQRAEAAEAAAKAARPGEAPAPEPMPSAVDGGDVGAE